jgi:predicted DNA-binding protein (UPF0251 family)
MSRPQKCRRVASVPGTTFFKPAGIPIRSLKEIRLSLEEVEALRLKEIEGLDQKAASERMNISRPTFQRVLAAARHKVADALFSAKAIRITGGNVEMAFSRFRCRRGHEWDTPYEVIGPPVSAICPTCNTPGEVTQLPVLPEHVVKVKDEQGAV